MTVLQGRGPGDFQGMSVRSDLDVFERNPDPALDEIIELAAVLSNADYAYLGSMDQNRLCFKSQFGFKALEQPRWSSGCQRMLELAAPLLIPDAAKDGRFPPTGIPLPGARPCRSYAGTPIVGPDHQIIGSFAVLAQLPNRFKPEHLTLLDVLGRQVMTRIELYNRIRAQEQAHRSRMRTERALSTERLFVAATLDSVPALLAVLDTAGRTVRINQSCAHLTGLTLANAVGRPFLDEVLGSEDRHWIAARLREAAAGLAFGPHESEWRNAGGKVRRVSWTLRPLQGNNNEIQYLILSGQDVTEQREIEQALHSSQARYREIVENSLGFVFTCSMEGRLTSLNAFTAETLGYRPEALVGRAVVDLLDKQGIADFQDCLWSLQSNEDWQGALAFRRSDGVYRRIAFRSRRTMLPGERPFVLIHGIDVTELHQAEQALHMATRQRELILESVGDGIFGIDLDGRVTFVNPAGAATLACTPEQLTGRDMHDVIHHSHADGTPYSRATSPILQALRRSESIRMRDEVFWRDDQTAFPVEYGANPILEDGRVSGMVVTFRDVSERRRLDKMKDEFISTVSHELRTPLTSLRASLGLIASGSLDTRPDKQHQMVEMAIANSDRLIRLVNDILDFDRVGKGKLPLDRRPVEAMALLRRAVDVAYANATQVRISLHIDAPPIQVLADEERILQVLNELVVNALKFSPSDTVIRLSAHPSGEGLVSFSVEDQGRGILPEKLERIFDRFQQGDASDSRDLGGTGLGLALCRSIVEQHDGLIWAESTPGKGSKFQFTLPAAPSLSPTV
jgi:two-component system, OmpR family, sensor histidine kinase VicK